MCEQSPSCRLQMSQLGHPNGRQWPARLLSVSMSTSGEELIPSHRQGRQGCEYVNDVGTQRNLNVTLAV